MGNARFERAAFGSGGRRRVPSCRFRLFTVPLRFIFILVFGSNRPEREKP